MSQIVFCVEHQNYTRKNGDEVDNYICHYFDPSEFENSALYKGVQLLNKVSSLGFENFPHVPGVYEMSSRPLKRFGNFVSSLKSLRFLKSVDSIVPKGEYFIVFGVRVVCNYKPLNSTQVLNGVKFFAIDPTGSDNLDIKGYPVFEQFISGLTLDSFPKIPAYYDFQFKEKRGKNGEAILEVVSVQYVESFFNSESLSQEGE